MAEIRVMDHSCAKFQGNLFFDFAMLCTFFKKITLKKKFTKIG
jgi:hypothetical protein